MTSGIFHSVEISLITVNRADRQRRELANIDELADSIRRLGLIHPLVVTRDLILVSGERRLTACTKLGWTHISCQYVDEIDPAHLRSIELEENVKRQDIPWQDYCKAVQEYHAIRKSEEPTWTQGQTADALGIKESEVSQRLDVAKEIVAGNKRIIEAPKYSVARGIVERSKSRQNAEALADLHREIAAPVEAPPEEILNEDFLKWAPTYAGPLFNFIHCDFPYGIGADKFNQGGAAAHGGYRDTADTYFALLEGFASNINRIAAESSHLLFWFSMEYYQETFDFLSTHTPFTINKFPLIWLKSDNAGILPDPSRGPRRIYETAFFGASGDRLISQPVANAYAAPTVRDRHMSEKPEPVLRHFFRMFVDEHTTIFDPTCGSGSALRAAESLGASRVLGLEINPDFAEIAYSALKQSRNLRAAS